MPVNPIHLVIVVGFVAAVVAAAWGTVKLVQPPDAPESTAFAQYRAVVRRFLVLGFGAAILAGVLAFAIGFVETNQLNSGRSADGWATARSALGVVFVCGIVLFPLLALAASERVVRRFSVPIATLAPRSATTLMPTLLLAVAAVAGVVASVTIIGAMIISCSPSDLEFTRALPQDWTALVLLVVAAALAAAVVRLAVSRGDLDAVEASDAWTRSGVATRAVALFLAAAAIATLLAADVHSNLAWAYRDATAAARQGWEWVEAVHLLGLSQTLPAIPFLLTVCALAMVAKPPVKVPGVVAAAVSP